METALSRLCAYIILSSLCTLLNCLQPSQKSVGEYLTHISGLFWFLINYSPKSEIVGSMDRTRYGKLTCLTAMPKFFLQKVTALGKVNNWFLYRNLKLFDSFENETSKFCFCVQSKQQMCEYPLFKRLRPIKFSQKCMIRGTDNFLIFFGIDLTQKLPCQSRKPVLVMFKRP